ncbi:MAG: cyclase family protein [Solirubrobacterales bacterium]
MAEAKGNWGRWGPEDERGAANLVDAATTRAALGIPGTGRVYPLGQRVQAAGVPRGKSAPPPLHMFIRDGADFVAGREYEEGKGSALDWIGLNVHGATTHVDALGHVFDEGKLYNGYEISGSKSSGLERCGIENLGGLVTRGVLVDLPRRREVEALPAGHEITAADLEDALGAQGTELRPGDAVLIRTGMTRRFETEPDPFAGPIAGLGLDGAEFLSARDVALVGADNNAVEVYPFKPGTSAPVHRHLLVAHGIYLIEFLDLEELAAAGVHEFLFVLAPLRIAGGTGSPVNPLAIG